MGFKAGSIRSERAPEVLPDRLIAFLDILGFSHRLTQMTLEGLHAEYARVIDEADRTVFAPPNLLDPKGPPISNFARAQFVFDSVVLVSHPTVGKSRGQAVFNFISGLLVLMEKSFHAQFPLRGCIGFGDYLDDSRRRIFLSGQFPAIVRAEKAQEWSGAYLLEEAATVAIDAMYGRTAEQHAASPLREHQLLRHSVPLKEGAALEAWCLNWPSFLTMPELNRGLVFMTGPKAENTRTFANYCRNLPDITVELPQGYRPATTLRLQPCAAGMRLQFTNAEGITVDPPSGWKMRINLVTINRDDDPAE